MKFSIAGNKEILEESQHCMGTQLFSESLPQNYNFGINDHKVCKIRYQSFWVLSNFAWFLNLSQIILHSIVYRSKRSLKTHLSHLQFSICWHFMYIQILFEDLTRKIAESSSENFSKLEVLCKFYLACWIQIKNWL